MGYELIINVKEPLILCGRENSKSTLEDRLTEINAEIDDVKFELYLFIGGGFKLEEKEEASELVSKIKSLLDNLENLTRIKQIVEIALKNKEFLEESF